MHIERYTHRQSNDPLTPRTCVYVTYMEKRDSDDVIKLRTLDGEIILDYLYGSNILKQVFKSRGERQE